MGSRRRFVKAGFEELGGEAENRFYPPDGGKIQGSDSVLLEPTL
ncbi:MAG: hypothetical protein CM1200mP9_04820 [Gammaproteobacteria bacterium]|nr:MAG: hypothetical protein CM1200mP9_04820 [Gammaproteobacteria bacterium]